MWTGSPDADAVSHGDLWNELMEDTAPPSLLPGPLLAHPDAEMPPLPVGAGVRGAELHEEFLREGEQPAAGFFSDLVDNSLGFVLDLEAGLTGDIGGEPAERLGEEAAVNGEESAEEAADVPLDDLPEEINVRELGLDGLGAHGSPGETTCLFCFQALPPGPWNNKRWHHNVQHPRAAATLLSSRPNPSSGIVEKWTVQLKPRRGPMLRLQQKAQAPWFARKVDRDGNKVRRTLLTNEPSLLHSHRCPMYHC